MRKIIIAFLICLSVYGSYAQGKYLVYLKDKPNTSAFLQNPSSFLSEAALLRRANHGLGLDITDVPIESSYIKQIEDLGIEVKHPLKWLNAVSVQIDSDDKLAQLQSLEFVTSIECLQVQSGVRSIENSKAEPVIALNFIPNSKDLYGVSYPQHEMINIDKLHALGLTGKGVKIGVFDAGFTNVNTLNFFERAREENRIHPIWNYVFEDNDVYKGSSHGTYVLSTQTAWLPGLMIGVAPEADYYLFVTEDDRSEKRIEEDNWAAAAEKADSMGIEVFSTSLGYSTFDADSENYTYSQMDGQTTIITKAAAMAARKGILVVNSAGNSGNSSWRHITAPADADSVFTVGAVDTGLNLANFSSRGPNSRGVIKPNVCAQGVGTVVSFSNGLAGRSNGTSFSCPIIAGASACLWQGYPELSSYELMQVIQNSSDRASMPDNDFGYGVPDFYKAWKTLQNKTYEGGSSLKLQNFYPNPFQDQIELIWFSDEDYTMKVELFDAQGRRIADENITILSGNYDKLFIKGLQGLQKGVYYVRLTHHDQSTVSKLIKG